MFMFINFIITVYGCTHDVLATAQVRGKFCGADFLLCLCGLGDETQAVRLYRLSHLTVPVCMVSGNIPLSFDLHFPID